jgi:hypothetical protein
MSGKSTKYMSLPLRLFLIALPVSVRKKTQGRRPGRNSPASFYLIGRNKVNEGHGAGRTRIRPTRKQRSMSMTHFLKYSLLLAILSITCWAQGNEGNQHADTFKADLALISLPAPSNEGCPANTVRFDVTGSGSATNLGSTSVSEFVCLDTASLLFTAQFTLTAENGDKVFGIASGFGVPTSATTFDVRGTWNFTAGTGRFKGMRGNGTSLGHVNLVTGASPHELIGNITNTDSPE